MNHPLSRPHRTHRSDQGFTLIELLIVIAILAVLAAILIPSYTGAQKKPYDTAALQCGRAIITGSHAYKAEHGAYPQGEQTVAILGEDAQEACQGVRIMPYAVPTSTVGNETALTWNPRGPSFFVAHNKGSGVYTYNKLDPVNEGKLTFVRWGVYGL